MKILLMDDSKLVLEHIKRLLSGLGHDVQGAVNIAEALGRLRLERPEVILVDYVLGDGQTGLQAIETMQGFAKNGNIPTKEWALLTHASLSGKDEERARELGVSVLAKPTHGRENDFLDSIRALLVDAA